MTLLLFACNGKERDPEPPAPTQIEGLELTFINTQFSQATPVIEFTSETTGFLGDFFGGIFKTTDGGLSWRQVQTNSDLPIYDIEFLDANEGWAVGGDTWCPGDNCTPPGALILHTTDGGETWSHVAINTKEPILLTSIDFVNDQLGFATGMLSILRTTDGGETWNETIVEDHGFLLMNVSFFDEQNGIITGAFNKVFKTNDGGNNWKIIDQYDEFGGYTLATSGNAGFASQDTTFHRSNDKGETWSPIHTFKGSIWSMLFLSETHGLAVGAGEWVPGDPGHGYAAMYYTTDGGDSWVGTNHVHEMPTITNVSFPTPDVGYGVGFASLVKIKLK